MTRFYRVCAWNANGLANHCQELQAFISQNKIDIMLVSETHFTDISYFKIPNFLMYHAHHPDNRAHGGSAILIRNNIKHHELPSYRHNHIQSTSIVIEDWSGPLTVSAIYSPPRHNISNQQFTDFFNTLGGRFIVGGDYNAKHTLWGSRMNNPRGRQLLTSINNNSLQYVSTGEPTYWPTDQQKVPDLLDFFVIKGISQTYIQIESSLDLSSDHSPIILTISSSVIKKEPPFSLSNNNTDWNHFRKLINENLSLKMSLKTTEEIETAVENFNSALQECALQASPHQKIKAVCQMSYPLYIKKKIAEKRRLRRIWQNSRSPVDKTNFNRAAQELKRLLRNLKNEWFNDFASGLSPKEDSNYSLWKITKRLNQPRPTIPPILLPDGSWARNNQEKSEAFADHLSNVFKPNPTAHVNDKEIQDLLNSPSQLSLPIHPFKISEVINVIKTELKPFKAPGYDLITGKMLKELPKKAFMFLTFIFNAILRIEHFPAQWKVSDIIMVAKPGKPVHEVTSYRPISLLPIASKVMEKLLLKRLQNIIHLNNMIPSHQFGFRQKHSTIEQVHRVVSVIKEDLESKKFCSAAFLDVGQAFDKVWHDGLLYKIKLNFPHTYFNVLRSYLSNRFFRVKLEDSYTHLHKIDAGVPQGSVLGPILYTLFTADIPVSPDITLATFADDTAVLASHLNPITASRLLQTELDYLTNWLKTWRIKVNETKSTHVTFTMKQDTCPPVSLNNVFLPQATEVKYLGIHLDRRLTWRSHIWNKRLSLNLKFRKLSWLLNKKSQLSTKNKLLVYKVVLKPVWTYGIQLWGTACDSNINILQRFQSKVLRNILRAPWYVNNNVLHRDTNIPSVREEITRFSLKYQLKLGNHPNHLALHLLDNSNFVYRLNKHSILDLPYRF